jgi:hypothetical protein
MWRQDPISKMLGMLNGHCSIGVQWINHYFSETVIFITYVVWEVTGFNLGWDTSCSEVVCVFLSSLQVVAGKVPQIEAGLLPSQFLPNHYSLIILWLYATQHEFLTVAVNKPVVNNINQAKITEYFSCGCFRICYKGFLENNVCLHTNTHA